MASELTVDPACTRCGKRMGEMSEDESVSLVLIDGDAGLCFDCDPESASTTPSIFWQWRQGESFVIDGERFEVWALPGNAAELVQSHAHGRMRARGLSSYTKLNRISKNHVLLGNGLEVRMCDNCFGVGQLFEYDGVIDCPECEGSGMKECAIFVPHWILSLGCEND